MSSCLCPGSYDPITFGHMDVIRRAAGLFDEVVVGVLNSTSKKYLFTLDERVTMAAEAFSDDGITVVGWDGLLVRLLERLQINIVLRGVRGITDFEIEEQIADVNRQLRPETETLFLPAAAQYRAISSTIVRELIAFGADVEAFVPESVIRQLSWRASS